MASKQQLTSMFATLKIEEAAKELGMGVTALKKQCRQHGIYRWPHRQLKSLDKLIRELEEIHFSPAANTEAKCVEVAVMQLRNYKQRILIDPCYKIPLSVFRLRQAQFKDKHKRSNKRVCD